MIDSVKLQKIATAQGISNPYKLAKAARDKGYGFSTSSAQRLWTAEGDTKGSSVAALIDVLDCEFSDITCSLREVRKRRKAAPQKQAAKTQRKRN